MFDAQRAIGESVMLPKSDDARLGISAQPESDRDRNVIDTHSDKPGKGATPPVVKANPALCYQLDRHPPRSADGQPDASLLSVRLAERRGYAHVARYSEETDWLGKAPLNTKAKLTAAQLPVWRKTRLPGIRTNDCPGCQGPIVRLCHMRFVRWTECPRQGSQVQIREVSLALHTTGLGSQTCNVAILPATHFEDIRKWPADDRT